MVHGVAFIQTADGMSPGEIAQLAEGLGFESLFFIDHTHMPVGSEGFPQEYVAVGSEGFPQEYVAVPGEGTLHDIPGEYGRAMDPFVAATAAACATTRLLLGTGICLVVERDPIITAKLVASVDVLSNGRFLFGVGAGWNKAEMWNHGTDPKRRFTIMRERVEAMKEIWTQQVASYHGDFVKSIALSRGRSQFSNHIRRCSWGATGKQLRTGSWHSATSGSLR